jgi:hypothetical protein
MSASVAASFRSKVSSLHGVAVAEVLDAAPDFADHQHG